MLILQLGLYLILFPSLGAMLLPLCIIVPAHIIRQAAAFCSIDFMLQLCAITKPMQAVSEHPSCHRHTGCCAGRCMLVYHMGGIQGWKSQLRPL